MCSSAPHTPGQHGRCSWPAALAHVRGCSGAQYHPLCQRGRRSPALAAAHPQQCSVSTYGAHFCALGEYTGDERCSMAWHGVARQGKGQGISTHPLSRTMQGPKKPLKTLNPPRRGRQWQQLICVMLWLILLCILCQINTNILHNNTTHECVHVCMYVLRTRPKSRHSPPTMRCCTTRSSAAQALLANEEPGAESAAAAAAPVPATRSRAAGARRSRRSGDNSPLVIVHSTTSPSVETLARASVRCISSGCERMPRCAQACRRAESD